MPKLEITIGPKPDLLSSVLRVCSMLASVMAIPTFNELVLHGHWSVNLLGFIIGMIAVAAAWKPFMPTVAAFETKEDAAAWVESGAWKKPR